MSSSQTEALGALLKSSNGASASECKVALTRLSSELKTRGSRGSSASHEFFSSALDALTSLRGTANSELRMFCVLECAKYFFNAGFPTPALQAAQTLEKFASKLGNAYWLRKAHAIAGLVYADAASLGEALPHFAQSLAISREQGDLDAEITTLVNLGVALNYGALYREALPCLHAAADIAAKTPELSWRRGLALCNIAQSYYYLEEYDRAFEAINRALEGVGEPEDLPSAQSRAIREFTYVQIALELGKLALARQHSALCRRFGQWGDNKRCRAMVQIADALCEIHGGDVERGIAILENALATGTDLESVRADILVALVKAYDEASRPESALRFMHQLLEHYRSAREKGLLAISAMPHTGSVLSTNGDSGIRSLELREARLKTQVAEREVVNSRIEMLERLAVTADLREESSGEHGYRVGKIAALLAKDIGLEQEYVRVIETAARLHDIGKLGMPDRILFTSKELEDAERRFISTHAIVGAELLAKSNIPQLRMAEEIARHHHEWWDGTGYPTKLSGKRIPIHARIVALADVFDALTHGRPFAAPWSMDRAIEEVGSRRGTQFDPGLTDKFIELIARLRKEHDNLDDYLGQAGRNSPFLQARNKIKLLLAQEHENERKATVAGTETRH